VSVWDCLKRADAGRTARGLRPFFKDGAALRVVSSVRRRYSMWELGGVHVVQTDDGPIATLRGRAGKLRLISRARGESKRLQVGFYERNRPAVVSGIRSWRTTILEPSFRGGRTPVHCLGDRPFFSVMYWTSRNQAEMCGAASFFARNWTRGASTLVSGTDTLTAL
jgi:hypothetical protein